MLEDHKEVQREGETGVGVGQGVNGEYEQVGGDRSEALKANRTNENRQP